MEEAETLPYEMYKLSVIHLLVSECVNCSAMRLCGTPASIQRAPVPASLRSFVIYCWCLQAGVQLLSPKCCFFVCFIIYFFNFS